MNSRSSTSRRALALLSLLATASVLAAPAAGQVASQGLRGASTQTSVFGLAGEGSKFVYVFDRSGSMSEHGGAPLATAKAELLKSLEDLSKTDQFQIIFYNHEPRIFNPSGVAGRLVFGNDQNKDSAKQFVENITADGGTDHEKALHLALRMAPDVIFFLTDADEPELDAKQLERVARLNNGTVIHTIRFGSGEKEDPKSFLVKLAEQNGGKHAYVNVLKLKKGGKK